MERIWSESKTTRVSTADGGDFHDFCADVTADLGVTQDHHTVLRIDTAIRHWPGRSDESCREKSCKLCGGGRSMVTVDPNRLDRSQAIRLAVRAADALWEEMEEIVLEARLVLSPPEPTPDEEAPRG